MIKKRGDEEREEMERRDVERHVRQMIGDEKSSALDGVEVRVD